LIIITAFEAPAVVAGLDDIAMVGQAVEQRGGHLDIAEHAGPFAEGEVGGDNDRGTFVEPTEEVEQELATGLIERESLCYIERQGRCTRCAKLFADGKVAYMVREKVGWKWIPDMDCFLGHDWRWVAVCESCVKPREATDHRLSRECPGCGLSISTSHQYGHVFADLCSDACRQRVYRKEHRHEKLHCDVCGNEFTSARRDSNFCSNACRQAEYRKRKAAA
jgi:hypothetical protein